MYFGTMPKFGPLANSDSCTAVREVLVRLMTHFSLVFLLVLLVPAVGAVNVGAGAVGADAVGVLPLVLELVLG